jgi:hypothetical protein
MAIGALPRHCFSTRRPSTGSGVKASGQTASSTPAADLMRLAGVLAIVCWAMSFRSVRLRPHRRRLGYLALCMALVPLTVGGL